MAHWLRRIFRFVFYVFLRRTQRKFVRSAKIRALKVYLQALQASRQLVIAYTGLLILLQVLTLGVVVLLAGVTLMLPWTLESKGIFLTIVGGVLFLLPTVLLSMALSEKTWYRASRADELMRQAVGQPESKDESESVPGSVPNGRDRSSSNVEKTP